MRRVVRGGLAISVVLFAAPALAVDVGAVGGDTVQLDGTETSIAAQHFAARSPPGQSLPQPTTLEDSGWVGWINRLDSTLRWGHWTVGLRLDSAVYAERPVDHESFGVSDGPEQPELAEVGRAADRRGQRVALQELDLSGEAVGHVLGVRRRGDGRRRVRAVRPRADALDAQGGRARDRHDDPRRQDRRSPGTRSPSPPWPGSPTPRASTRPPAARCG